MRNDEINGQDRPKDGDGTMKAKKRYCRKWLACMLVVAMALMGVPAAAFATNDLAPAEDSTGIVSTTELASTEESTVDDATESGEEVLATEDAAASKDEEAALSAQAANTSCSGGESCAHAAAITVGETTTHYDTLAEALSAAQNGQTVEMLKDFENADLAKSVDFTLKDGVTLDGKGHYIRGNASVNMATAANATSTIQNVNFQYIHNNSAASQSDCEWYGWVDGKSGTKTAIYASSLAGTMNVLNCTFDNCDWDAIQITPKKGATIN